MKEGGEFASLNFGDGFGLIRSEFVEFGESEIWKFGRFLEGGEDVLFEEILEN